VGLQSFEAGVWFHVTRQCKENSSSGASPSTEATQPISVRLRRSLRRERRV
jgi:hypothetical protein